MSRLAVLAAAVLSIPTLAVAQTGTVSGTVAALNTRLGGAVVSLVRLDPPSDPPVADTAMIDQRDLRFSPRVLAVRPGTTVEFRNSDPILHNVFSPRGVGSGFDLGTYPRLTSKTHRFVEPGAHVILCHVHPEMLAYVVVVESRHHAVVGADQRFSISDIPPGRYRLRVWHRRTAPFERVVVVPNGRLTLELQLEGN